MQLTNRYRSYDNLAVKFGNKSTVHRLGNVRLSACKGCNWGCVKRFRNPKATHAEFNAYQCICFLYYSAITICMHINACKFYCSKNYN